MLYVIAVPRLAPSVQEVLAHFRAVYEPERARLVAPHVTLVFGMAGFDPASFADFCRHAVVGHKSFPVAFEGHEISFDPVERLHKLALLCSDGKGSVISLHQALYAGEHRSQLRDDIAYRPHMTIAAHGSASALSDIDTSDIFGTPIHGVIDSLEVVQLSDGVLHSIARIPLGAG